MGTSCSVQTEQAGSIRSQTLHLCIYVNILKMGFSVISRDFKTSGFIKLQVAVGFPTRKWKYPLVFFLTRGPPWSSALTQNEEDSRLSYFIQNESDSVPC